MSTVKATIASLALAISVVARATDPAGAAGPEPTATRTALQKLPAAVQRTARAEGTGATIRAVKRETDAQGRPVYEVEMRVNGLTRDILIAQDGTLLMKEEQVRMRDLPAAVRATVLKRAAGRPIALVEIVTPHDGTAYYEAHIRKGAALLEVKTDLEGRPLP